MFIHLTNMLSINAFHKQNKFTTFIINVLNVFYLFISGSVCLLLHQGGSKNNPASAQLASSATSEWQLVKKSINNAEYWGLAPC